LLFIITPRPDIVVVLPSARQYSSGIINTEIMPTAEITNSNYYDSANSIYLYLEYHQTDENLVKYTASIIISKYSDCL
ncbi:MAG: hypothetical protein NDI73_12320, partial [Desulfuromonadales bacterium]|nr:hypothetical protein [Desulfuromonadales bacterium]